MQARWLCGRTTPACGPLSRAWRELALHSACPECDLLQLQIDLCRFTLRRGALDQPRLLRPEGALFAHDDILPDRARLGGDHAAAFSVPLLDSPLVWKLFSLPPVLHCVARSPPFKINLPFLRLCLPASPRSGTLLQKSPADSRAAPLLHFPLLPCAAPPRTLHGLKNIVEIDDDDVEIPAVKSYFKIGPGVGD